MAFALSLVADLTVAALGIPLWIARELPAWTFVLAQITPNHRAVGALPANCEWRSGSWVEFGTNVVE